jgi:hypothetical protein
MLDEQAEGPYSLTWDLHCYSYPYPYPYPSSCQVVRAWAPGMASHPTELVGVVGTGEGVGVEIGFV